MTGIDPAEIDRGGALRHVTHKAVADAGFRQAVVWSPADVGRRYGLTTGEVAFLERELIPRLRRLPVPIEPADLPANLEPFDRILTAGDRPPSPSAGSG